MKTQTKGALIILLSSVFFGSYGVWARLIGTNIDNLVQVWTRSLLIVLILVPISLLTKSLRKIDKSDIKWVLIYSLFGACAVAPFFYAANEIGVGPSTLLFYSAYTITSYILGLLFFSEKITKLKFISLLLALMGLSLIFNFSYQSGNLLPALAAIISGVGGGIEVVFTKKLSTKYSSLQISLQLWLVTFVLHFLLSLVFNSPIPSLSLSLPWFAVLGYGLASLGAFYLVSVGYKYVEPSVGSIIGLLEIIFGVTFGVIFFKESLTLPIILGSILIIISAASPNLKVLNIFNKRQQ